MELCIRPIVAHGSFLSGMGQQKANMTRSSGAGMAAHCASLSLAGPVLRNSKHNRQPMSLMGSIFDRSGQSCLPVYVCFAPIVLQKSAAFTAPGWI